MYMDFIKRGLDKVKEFFRKNEVEPQQKQRSGEAAQDKEVKELVRQNHASAQELSKQIELLRSVLSSSRWNQETKSKMDGLLTAVQNKLSGNVEAVAEVKELDVAAKMLIDTIVRQSEQEVEHSEQEDADILCTALNALVNNLTKARYSVKENTINAGSLDLQYASLLIQKTAAARSLHALMAKRISNLEELQRLNATANDGNVMQRSQLAAVVSDLEKQIITSKSQLDLLNAKIMETETLREQYKNTTETSLVEQMREMNQKLAEQLSETVMNLAKEIEKHQHEIIGHVVKSQHETEKIKEMLLGMPYEMDETIQRQLAAYQLEKKESLAKQQTESQTQENQQTDEDADETPQLHV